MAYATITDLQNRLGRPLTSDEAARALILLDDAAVRLDAVCPPSTPPTDQELALRLMVSCEMVKRAMIAPGGIGVQSVQQSAGPYSETKQYTNPTGDLYLLKEERRLLGCGVQKAFTVSMSNSVYTDPFASLYGKPL